MVKAMKSNQLYTVAFVLIVNITQFSSGFSQTASKLVRLPFTINEVKCNMIFFQREGSLWVHNTDNVKHVISQCSLDGKLLREFSGCTLDSLNLVTSFLVHDDKFVFLDYSDNRPFQSIVFPDKDYKKYFRLIILNTDLDIIRCDTLESNADNLVLSDKQGQYLHSEGRTIFDTVRMFYHDVKMYPSKKVVGSRMYILPSTPHRENPFFLVTTTGGFITAFANVYDVKLHRYDSSSVKFFPPDYTLKPYSDADYESMSEMKAFLLREYEPYPPAIENICVSDEFLYIIRGLRPTDEKLTIDYYNIVSGEYIDTFCFENRNMKLLDCFVFENNFYIIVRENDQCFLSYLSPGSF